jgi:transcriptional regulator NrdR family protein
MYLHCPKCQNLIEKVSDTLAEGKVIDRMCQRCEKRVSYIVKYKAISDTKKRIDRSKER